jgi:hypothetical protein
MMKTLPKLLKLSIVLTVWLLMMVTVPNAEAGVKWSGMDPDIFIDGVRVSVYTEWPSDMTCNLNNIRFFVLVPLGSEVNYEESEETFECEDGTQITHRTQTEVIHGLVSAVNVASLVETIDLEVSLSVLQLQLGIGISEFPTRVLVSKNGTLIRQCSGYTNTPVECLPFLVP